MHPRVSRVLFHFMRGGEGNHPANGRKANNHQLNISRYRMFLHGTVRAFEQPPFFLSLTHRVQKYSRGEGFMSGT